MLIETVLAHREKTHGLYSDQAKLSQTLKRIFRGTKNWGRLDDCQAQSLELFCDKLSRILNGDHNESDHWQDIAGYATLIVKELETMTGGSKHPEIPYAKMPVSMRSVPTDGPLDPPEFLVKQMESDLKDALNK